MFPVIARDEAIQKLSGEPGLLRYVVPRHCELAKQSRRPVVDLDCFVPRNDGGIAMTGRGYRHCELAKQSRSPEVNLDCFVPRNDDAYIPSLRGVIKKNRKRTMILNTFPKFAGNYSMSNQSV